MSEKKWNIGREEWSQADSYIEKKFEEACGLFPGGHEILNEWRKRKEQYISYTNLIVIDYQHYSRHDVTHSIRILQAIELVLGIERVNKLGAGDLWLLLETAYFHDIGMAVTYKELEELWDNDDFKDFLDSAEVKEDADLIEARNWYVEMDNLVNDRERFLNIENEEESVFDEKWAVELERKLLFLITAYIRKDHAKRCKKYLRRFSKYSSGSVPDRLYQVVAEITVAHGESFSYLRQNLKIKSQGLGMDYIHPQFIAVLLRLGDLLDIDNNRFNLRAIEHYGSIPWTSKLHLKKHKAMTHIMICHERIEAESEHEDMEVCQLTQNWFRYIEQEVEDLICSWSEIAPKDMKGCLMRKAICKVYHPKAPTEFKSDWQKTFEVDKAKLTELLIGANIYDIKLDFLREYIQNALDASKMQLWLDLKGGKYQYRCNPDVYDMKKLTPFDISKEVYDQYEIEVRIALDSDRKVDFEIIDHGIGMEDSCLEVISKIGKGWRGRKHYNKEIPQMLPWLRPTGGFGIGIQSAFMLTDQVQLVTKSDSELQSHRVILNSPKTSGKIIEETSFDHTKRGTVVKLTVDLDFFQKWNEELADRHALNEDKNEWTVYEMLGFHDYSGEDVFSKDDELSYVIKYVENYLKEIIADTFIPIRITSPDREPVLLQSEFMGMLSFWSDNRRYISGTETDTGGDYRWVYDLYKNELAIWHEKESVYTYIKNEQKTMERKHTACFKNVCVVRNTNFKYPLAEDFTICVDFMGHTAENALKVHRNEFNEGFSQKKYIMKAIDIFVKVMFDIKSRFTDVKELMEKINGNLYETNALLVYLLYLDNHMLIPSEANRKIDKVNYKINTSIRHTGQDIASNVITDTSTDGEQAPALGNDTEDTVLHKERQDEGTREAEIVKSFSYIEMSTLLSWVQEILNGTESERLYMYCPKERRKEQKPVTMKKILTKLDSDASGKRPVDWENFQEEFSTVDLMQKTTGLDVIWEKEYSIYSILVESDMFDVSYLQFDEDDTAGGDIAIFRRKQTEVSDESLQEYDFYVALFGREGRALLGMPDAANYKKLMVSKLPYNKDMKRNGPYLISPVNQKIRIEINQKTKNIPKIKYPYDKFIKIIMEDSAFQEMLDWVYKNQVESGKYTKEELREEYRKLASDIYTKYLYSDESVDKK